MSETTTIELKKTTKERLEKEFENGKRLSRNDMIERLLDFYNAPQQRIKDDLDTLRLHIYQYTKDQSKTDELMITVNNCLQELFYDPKFHLLLKEMEYYEKFPVKITEDGWIKALQNCGIKKDEYQHYIDLYKDYKVTK